MEIKIESLYETSKPNDEGKSCLRFGGKMTKSRKKVIRKRRVIKSQQRIFVDLVTAEKNNRAALVFLSMAG